MRINCFFRYYLLILYLHFSSMTTVLAKCWDISDIKSVSSHETMTYFTNGIFHTLHNMWDHLYHLPTELVDMDKKSPISQQEANKKLRLVNIDKKFIFHQSPFYHVHLEVVSNITLLSGYYELNTLYIC